MLICEFHDRVDGDIDAAIGHLDIIGLRCAERKEDVYVFFRS